jgi:hypothetical protein
MVLLQFLQEIGEVRRRRRFPFHQLAADRMRQAEPNGVQGLTLEGWQAWRKTR